MLTGDLLREDHLMGAQGDKVAVRGLPKPSLQPCPGAPAGVETRFFHVSRVQLANRANQTCVERWVEGKRFLC